MLFYGLFRYSADAAAMISVLRSPKSLHHARLRQSIVFPCHAIFARKVAKRVLISSLIFLHDT